MLTYELLTGASPFTLDGEKNVPADISKRILKAQPIMPRTFSKRARDFILRLLNKSPSKRLGAGGAAEVKAHPFFEGINWEDLAAKRVPAPFKPPLHNELDTNNFADEFTRQRACDSPGILPPHSNNEEHLFRVSVVTRYLLQNVRLLMLYHPFELFNRVILMWHLTSFSTLSSPPVTPT